MMNRLFGGKDKKADKNSSSPPAPSAVSSSSTSTSPFGLPPYLSSNPDYIEAIELINRAIRFEDVYDFTKAIDHYNNGLQILFDLLKATPKDDGNAQHQRSREILRSVIDQFLSRAEQAKCKKMGKLSNNSGTNQRSQTQISPVFMAPGLIKNQSSSSIANPSLSRSTSNPSASTSSPASASSKSVPVYPVDPALRASIESEILSTPTSVRFSDIIGLEEVKTALHEMVVLPSLRPDLFTGVRAPPKGLLVAGPPGCGKTLIAKACAGESNCTFFAISASSLMSKHLGEGEKLVRALFQLAREKAPSIIFIDEIDSLLSRRSSDEHEASRRLKTEFFICLDGVNSDPSARVMIMAATNCPEDLDEALIRRLTRRIYIPVPDKPARLALLQSLLSQPTISHNLTRSELDDLAHRTANYSNSDLTALVSYAAMSPIRNIAPSELMKLKPSQVPPITRQHFEEALAKVRPSTTPERLHQYGEWARKQEQSG